MFNKEKLAQAMEILGELSEEKKALLTEAAGKETAEKELLEKLGVDEEKFAAFLRALTADPEEAILAQQVSEEELNGVTGGGKCPSQAQKDTFGANDCQTGGTTRWIYRRKFPNCAQSVESGSWCNSNDACYSYSSVHYTGMNDCSRSWK